MYKKKLYLLFICLNPVPTNIILFKHITNWKFLNSNNLHGKNYEFNFILCLLQKYDIINR